MGKVSGGTTTGGTVRLEGEDARYDYVNMWQQTFTSSKTNGEVFVYSGPSNITMQSTGASVQATNTATKSNETKEEDKGFDWTFGWKDRLNSYKDLFTGIVAAIAAAAVVVLAFVYGGASGDDRVDEDRKDAKQPEKMTTGKSMKEVATNIIKFDINRYVNEKAQTALFGKTFKDISKLSKSGELNGVRQRLGNLTVKVVSFNVLDTFLHNPVQRIMFKGKTLNEIVKGDTKIETVFNEKTGRVEAIKTVNKSNNPLAHLVNDIVKFDIFEKVNETLQTASLGKTFKSIQLDQTTRKSAFEKLEKDVQKYFNSDQIVAFKNEYQATGQKSLDGFFGHMAKPIEDAKQAQFEVTTGRLFSTDEMSKFRAEFDKQNPMGTNADFRDSMKDTILDREIENRFDAREVASFKAEYNIRNPFSANEAGFKDFMRGKVSEDKFNEAIEKHLSKDQLDEIKSNFNTVFNKNEFREAVMDKINEVKNQKFEEGAIKTLGEDRYSQLKDSYNAFSLDPSIEGFKASIQESLQEAREQKFEEYAARQMGQERFDNFKESYHELGFDPSFESFKEKTEEFIDKVKMEKFEDYAIRNLGESRFENLKEAYHELGFDPSNEAFKEKIEEYIDKAKFEKFEEYATKHIGEDKFDELLDAYEQQTDNPTFDEFRSIVDIEVEATKFEKFEGYAIRELGEEKYDEVKNVFYDNNEEGSINELREVIKDSIDEKYNEIIENTYSQEELQELREDYELQAEKPTEEGFKEYMQDMVKSQQK